MRKLVLITFGVLGLLTLGPTATPANAASQWCSKHLGTMHCAYDTREQCRASRSGRGGSCVRRQASR